MKKYIIVTVFLVFSLGGLRAQEVQPINLKEITTTDGEIYSNVNVTKITNGYVRFIHNTGSASLPIGKIKKDDYSKALFDRFEIMNQQEKTVQAQQEKELSSNVGKRIGDTKEMFIKRYGKPSGDSDDLSFETESMLIDVKFENNKAVEIGYRTKNKRPSVASLSTIYSYQVSSSNEQYNLVDKILKTQWDGEWGSPSKSELSGEFSTITWITTDNSLEAQWTQYKKDSAFFGFRVWKRAWAAAQHESELKANMENAAKRTQSKLNDL